MSYADPGRAPQAHLTREEAPEEPTGPIASDSLAAESIRAGGGFSENQNPEVLGVKGANSTLNTTDTSGASVLHPAASGAVREKEDEMGLGRDERGVSGVKYPEGAGEAKFDGSHNLDGYTGGPSSEKMSSGYDTSASGGNLGATPDARNVSSSGASAGASSGPSAGAGVRPYVDEAPTSQSGILPPGSSKPKGKNLTEGGIPETKTFTGDVGGPNDPGRLAEQKFQRDNANTEFGAGEQETGAVKRNDKGGFEVLESERA